MTDIQPDYTPFLNLVRPDTHDDIRTTVNKLRDALDAVDAWASSQGGSSNVRVIDATTPKDVDGNVAVLATDGTLLIDTSAMDPNTDYVALSLPMSPAVGTTIRAIRVSPDDNVGVYFTTGNTDPASYGGTDSTLYHQFEERIAYWAGSGLYGDHSDAGGWSIYGSGATTMWSLADFVFSQVPQDGIIDAVAYNSNTGKWGFTGVNNPCSFVAIDSASSGFPAQPGMVVMADASGGQTYVDLVNTIYSVVTVRKTDASSNPVTVQAQGGVEIDGAASLDLTVQNQTVVVIRDSVGAWHVILNASDGAGGGGGGATELSLLTDVQFNEPVGGGDVLFFNDGTGKWSNESPQWPIFLAALNDVLLPAPLEGQVLTYDGTADKWVARPAASGGASNLNGLTDVTIATLHDGDLLRYNGTDGQWENVAAYQLGLEFPQTVFPATSFGVGTVDVNAPPGAPTVFIVTCNSGDLTIQLPSAASAHDSSSQASGQVTAKKVDNTPYAMIVAAQPGETIDGAATFVVMTQYEAVTVVSDGTEWWVV